jgi:single-stranded-DNA-specific exonuclease
LAFKLAHALVKAGRQRGEAAEGELDVRGWLDLVALGTVADLVPLTGENRILVSAGLRGLAGTDRPGLRALRSVAGVSGAVGVYEAGFQLAPRLNAAGRLETAQDSLKLLLASDPTEAGVLAGRLDRRNRERQDLERRVAEQALARVRERFDPVRDRVIVEGDSEWHIGVVGIVASRLVKAFYRPTMVLGGDGVTWRGSGRSIEGFDLAAALRDCGDLLIRHGGHAMAAGVSVDPAAVPALRDRLNDLARARMGPDVWQPTLRLEGEPGLEELTVETVRELGRLEPVGQGNPPVQLRFRGVRVAGPVRRLGQDGRHAKFSVEQRGSRLDVVWWGGGQETQPSGNIDLAAVPELNTYQGRERVQLRLLDWCSAQAG